MSEHVEHRYLTDDRDRTDRAELFVAWAPNGDFYIGSRPEGHVYTWESVRICTSGGASSRNPRLMKAVADLFHALGGWESDLSDPPLSERKCEATPSSPAQADGVFPPEASL